MKKRILAVFVVILLLITSLPISKTYSESLGNINFYVAPSTEGGLDGKVSISFTQSNSSYSGTLYLPGSADTSKLFLSWEGTGVTVKIGGTTYQNGQVPIPAANASTTYSVTGDNGTANYTLKTMKGSEGVEGLFLTIDESKGTISAMNSDQNHTKECFGVVSFDGSTYDMTIKGRGNQSWKGADKKPYNITIYMDEDPEKGIEKYGKKQSVSFIPDVESKKWSLLTNYSDSTLMRNKIGYDLAEALGIGLDSKYVDIWMNGQYIGNYLMTPKTDYNAPKNGYMMELDNYVDNEDAQFRLQGLEAAAATSSQNLITIKDNGSGADTAEIQAWM